jgi:hypothetical protein
VCPVCGQQPANRTHFFSFFLYRAALIQLCKYVPSKLSLRDSSKKKIRWRVS